MPQQTSSTGPQAHSNALVSSTTMTDIMSESNTAVPTPQMNLYPQSPAFYAERKVPNPDQAPISCALS